MKQTTAKVQIIAAMLVFGSIGLFVRWIPLPSGVIAMVRGLVGAAMILGYMLLRGKKPDGAAIRKNLWLLLFSGTAIGFNWILLFEAYRFTSVATATLCYYLAPVFITALSPFVLKERLTGRKLLCVMVALLGMVPVSGILTSGFALSELKGVALGVGAAVLYATVILLNKKLRNISAMDSTMVQLFVAGAVLIPYVLFTADLPALVWSGAGIALLAVVAIVHTGVAYVLYFGSLAGLSAQTAAVLSYLDPVTAVALSALLLKEPLTVYTVIGAVMILGAALLGELEPKKKQV